nr:ribonuclease H-like domain-containing protein [Tanacetum cinerariifolium]
KIALEGLYMWKNPLPKLWLLLMELVLTEAIWLKMSLEEFKQPEFESYRPKSCEIESKNASEDIPNKLKRYINAPLVKDGVSNNKDCSVESPVMVNVVKASACWVWRPIKPNGTSITLKRHNYIDGPLQKVQEDQGYVDSGCSRHMTGNMSYLSDFKEFNGGYVTFRGGANCGRITGFFVGYSLNSKAFRVYNTRTRKVEENLHVRFLGDKPIIAGTNSNDFVGAEESFGAGQTSKETGSSKDYILRPLWKDGLLFNSSLKNASNDEIQPFNDVGSPSSGDVGKKHDKVSDKESGASNELNYAFENLNTKYPDDLKMHGLETIEIYDDSK